MSGQSTASKLAAARRRIAELEAALAEARQHIEDLEATYRTLHGMYQNLSERTPDDRQAQVPGLAAVRAR